MFLHDAPDNEYLYPEPQGDEDSTSDPPEEEFDEDEEAALVVSKVVHASQHTVVG